MPLRRKSRYSLVICKKLPQEQDCYFLCHLQAGSQSALLDSISVLCLLLVYEKNYYSALNCCMLERKRVRKILIIVTGN